MDGGVELCLLPASAMRISSPNLFKVSFLSGDIMSRSVSRLESSQRIMHHPTKKRNAAAAAADADDTTLRRRLLFAVRATATAETGEETRRKRPPMATAPDTDKPTNIFYLFIYFKSQLKLPYVFFKIYEIRMDDILSLSSDFLTVLNTTL